MGYLNICHCPNDSRMYLTVAPRFVDRDKNAAANILLTGTSSIRPTALSRTRSSYNCKDKEMCKKDDSSSSASKWKSSSEEKRDQNYLNCTEGQSSNPSSNLESIPLQAIKQLQQLN